MKRGARRRRETLPGSVRIIGGRWRGRRLRVPAAAVRPSADRVRETLFNWLLPYLPGARCLDLFAGTGVLGFEALSRGARTVTFLDREPAIVAHLRETSRLLAAEGVEILLYDALTWLATAGPEPYDIVFVDPPFDTELANAALAALAGGWVAPAGLVYVETPTPAVLPAGWVAWRASRTRQVVYALVAQSARPAHSTKGEI